MSITDAGKFESPYGKSAKEKYLEQDNVLDVTKEELRTIKKDIDLSKETDFDSHLNKINQQAEIAADGWILNNWDTQKTISLNGKSITKTVKDFLKDKNHDELLALAELLFREQGYPVEIQTIENQEIKTKLSSRKFQLNTLTLDVESNENLNQQTPQQGQEIEKDKETWDKDNIYKYTPEDFALTETGETGFIEFDYSDISLPGNDEGLINIFKKEKLRTHMEKILGQGEGKNREYNINLSPEHGLAGLIMYITTHNLWGSLKEKLDNRELSKPKDLFTFLKGFAYKRGNGWDNEAKKIFTIISNAVSDYNTENNTFTDESLGAALVDFAQEATNYGFDYEKRLKQGLNFQNIVDGADKNSILPLLCDFNGDGKLGVKYFDYMKKQEHKRLWKINYLKTQDKLPADRKKEWQKDRDEHKLDAKQQKESGKNIENQGDVGTIFGPQLYDAIQTASGILDVKIKYQDRTIIEKYGNVSGEQIIIYNILQTIGSLNITDKKIQDEISKITPANATSQNLLKLCNQFEEFQPFFAKAIEVINGSSSDLAPDLVDSLIGIERIPNVEYPLVRDEMGKDPYCEIRTHNPTISKFVKESTEEQFVQMKRGVMTILDNVDISAMINDTGKLTSLGISKAWDVNKREHEVKNAFLKTLFGAISSLEFTPSPTGATLGFVFGQNGATDSLRNLRARNTSINRVVGSPVFKVNVGGEYARQFNYSRVVTANLATLESATYGGVDGGVTEILIGGIPTVTILEGGIHYKADLKTSIEQMHDQYDKVSKRIFDIKNIRFEDMDTPEQLETVLNNRRIDLRQEFAKGGTKVGTSMMRFMDNNEEFLKTNIKQIVQYISAKKLLDVAKTSEKPAEALDSILNIFQDGLTNSWRETMYERIADKTTLSKVGLGLGISFIANTIPLIYPKISLRLKHWRNNYIPLAQQKNIDADLIRASGITHTMDLFAPESANSLEAYGEYMSAVFNIQEYNTTTKKYESAIKTEKTPEGHLKMTYTGSKAGHITDIIDLRVKVQNKVLENFKISPDGKSIIIGNVGPITAYTQADGLGKRCFLILGGSTTQNTCRIDSKDAEKHTIGNPQEGIKFEKNGYQSWNAEDLRTSILNKLEDNNAKTEVAAFFDTNGKLVTPSGKTVDWDKCGPGDPISTGTLTIFKKLDQSYEIKLENTPTDKLKLSYKEEAIYQSHLDNPNNRGERTSPAVLGNLFDYANSHINLKNADDEITKLAIELMDLEKNNYTAYAAFMAESSKTENGQINDAQLLKAIEQLKTILTDDKFSTITGLLANGDSYTKSYIVDRCKQMFAREAYYKNNTIAYILAKHGTKGLDQTGPSNKVLDAELKKNLQKIRSNWAKGLTYEDGVWNKNNNPKYKENPSPDKSLIGYTAFYRNIQGGYENKKFSLTGLGSTSYQDKFTLSGSDETSAKSWFLENFKTQEAEVSLFAAKLSEQLQAQNINIDLDTDNHAQLRKLLNGEEITIDNGTKKVKIETAMIFYLLGDCCNESIGLSLGKILIQQPKENAGRGSSGIRSAEAEPKAKYTSSSLLMSRNLSSSMKVGSYGEETGLNLSMVRTEGKDGDATVPGTEQADQDNDGTGPGVESDDGNTDITGAGISNGP